MSRIYLEAQEQVAQGQEAEHLRLDVTSKTQVERDAILVSLKDLMVGISTVFTSHTCNHDTGQSCVGVVV